MEHISYGPLRLESLHYNYATQLETHFPEFLRRLASTHPKCIILPGTRSLHFNWLIKGLWRPLGLGKTPGIHPLATLDKNKLDKAPANAESRRRLIGTFEAKIEKWVTERRLHGERLLVLDDVAMSGETLKLLKGALQKAGTVVTTAAFSDQRNHADISTGAYYGQGTFNFKQNVSRSSQHAGLKIAPRAETEYWANTRKLMKTIAHRIIENEAKPR